MVFGEEDSLQQSRRIDQICDEFEKAWRAGESPMLEDYLAENEGVPPVALLRALVPLELELSRKTSDTERTLTQDVGTDDNLRVPAKGRAADVTSAVPRLKPFADYYLIEELARGGMGIVYKARQKGLNRIVALKMIALAEFAAPEQVDRFHKEAELAANLDHPGIVPVYEVGKFENQHFFSMAFVEGESLAHLLNKGPLPPKTAAKYALEIAEAVAYAHSKGVIHRDLKPRNILISTEGVLRVTDFGLAKPIEQESELTATGQVLGTPSYMPPEQACGNKFEVGPRSDVYSIGATLYCMLVGCPPFQSASVVETLHQVIERDPVSLRSQNQSVPADLETICLKCLEKRPPDRYGSAAELVLELNRYLRGEPIAARPISRIERISRWCQRKPTAAAALALLVVMAVGGPWLGIQQTILRRENAIARIETLLNADPASIPVILDELDRDYGIVRSHLDRLKSAKLGPPQKLRLGLALLPFDRSQVDFLRRSLLDCEYEELRVTLNRMRQLDADASDRLWVEFLDDKTGTETRFRIGIALASLDPAGAAWQDEHYQLLVESLLQENPVYQNSIRRCLEPMSLKLLPALSACFRDRAKSTAVRDSAAYSLVDLGSGSEELLAELALESTPSQHAIVFPHLLARSGSPTATVAALKRFAANQPRKLTSHLPRVELGRRRAVAAVNLLRMNQPDLCLESLDVDDDHDALSQFVHGCAARGATVPLLIGLLERASHPTQRYGILLALGEFSFAEVPEDEQETTIEQLKQLYASDPSSAVHAASGWLLRNWGFAEEAREIEQRHVPYHSDREWFTLRIELLDDKPSYFTFVVFPSGDYRIGSPEYEPDHETGVESVRNVSISQAFAVLDREVCRGETTALTGFDGYDNDSFWEANPLSACTAISWYVAVQFCRSLSSRMGISEADQVYRSPKSLVPDYRRDPATRFYWEKDSPLNWPADFSQPGFRLPSSAEWEIACRSGTAGAYSFGSDVSLLRYYAWHADNSQRQAHLPQQLRPNRSGLFDIHGNLAEWCHDWVHDGNETLIDPRGPEEPFRELRILRGGSWFLDHTSCRSAAVTANQPSRTLYHYGFRIAMNIPPQD